MLINRRGFLLKAGALAAWSALSPPLPALAKTSSPLVRNHDLTAALSKINLGAGRRFKAFTYNGGAPGPVIRVKQGNTLRVKLKNLLPEPTTVHWHGLPVPNAMDGVPGVTQKPVAPGGEMTYQFTARPAGTYIYHSHQGLQLDQGLYGALIVEDPDEPRYDREFVLTLEDWVRADGAGPAARRRRPGRGMMMGRGMMGRRGMRGAAGDAFSEPAYDAFAVNGRVYPYDSAMVVKPGQRVRLRICNVSASTIYDLRLAGHALSVTHCDGQPVRPVETDVLRIAMGERYDVAFTADNPGHWLLGAYENGWGEGGLAIPLLYEGHRNQTPRRPEFSPGLRYLNYGDFSALNPSRPGVGQPDIRFRQVLSGGMHSPYWTINNRVHPDSELLSVRQGQVVGISYFNRSPMPHPMHLHGHFFRVVNPALPPELWIKKDTVIVDPMRRVDIQFLANNPGRWIHHCHNLYHMAAGMANLLEVT